MTILLFIYFPLNNSKLKMLDQIDGFLSLWLRELIVISLYREIASSSRWRLSQCGDTYRSIEYSTKSGGSSPPSHSSTRYLRWLWSTPWHSRWSFIGNRSYTRTPWTFSTWSLPLCSPSSLYSSWLHFGLRYESLRVKLFKIIIKYNVTKQLFCI